MTHLIESFVVLFHAPAPAMVAGPQSSEFQCTCFAW